jgi:hypothetical protein
MRAQEHAGATTDIESGIVKYITPDYEVHQYEKPEVSEDGGYEFEWVLNKKPESNVLTATIQTKNLVFDYQPPLTIDEIQRGNFRPENVIGSYAVYHTDKGIINNADGKEYKTGKAFHIFRPEAVDYTGEKTGCELYINAEDGILTVTIPQDFLDKANYPIVVDPTFGYTSQGASTYQITEFGGGGTIAMRGVSVDGDVSQLAAYLSEDYVFGDSTYKLRLSAQSGSWPGTTYVVDSGTQTVSGTSFTLKTHAASYTMSSGNWWVQVRAEAMGSGSAGTDVAYDSGSGDAADQLDELGPWSGSTNRFSVYATYTSSTPPTTINLSGADEDTGMLIGLKKFGG